MRTIKIVQIGLGPIGIKIARMIAQRKGLKIIGAVDISPELKGKDLGEVCGLEPMGVHVNDTVGACLKTQKADVAIVATVSSFEKIFQQIEQILPFSIPIVTTCEELSYPWKRYPELSGRLDAISKMHNVAVVGMGVNLGFLMDALPIFMTSVCQNVEFIRVERTQDAIARRLPFQKKIGTGLSQQDFEKKKQQGSLKHVGLPESVHAIAKRMGWPLTSVQESIKPILAEKPIETEDIKIPSGYCAGVLQIATGKVGDEIKIELVFKAAVGESNPRDFIEIKGTPSLSSIMNGGVNGDIATSAITINTIEQILDAKPGLRAITDIPLISYFQ